MLIPQDLSLVRLVMALLISIGHTVLLTATEPYSQASNNFFAIATSVTLICTLLSMCLLCAVIGCTNPYPLIFLGLALFTGVVCVSKPPFIFQSVFHKIAEHPDNIPEAVEAFIVYLSKQSQDLPQVI